MMKTASLAVGLAVLAAACSSTDNGTTTTGTSASGSTTTAASTTSSSSSAASTTTASTSTSASTSTGNTGTATATTSGSTSSTGTSGATTGVTTSGTGSSGTSASSGSSTGSTTGSTSGSTTGTAAPVLPWVFHGAYTATESYAPYGGSQGTPTIDAVDLYNGLPTLALTVPTSGAYTGGAIVDSAPDNLSTYNALSFWAKAQATVGGAAVTQAVDNVELGNDSNAATYQVQLNSLPLTGNWQQFYIPIPDPSKATAISGLFGFAQGALTAGVTILFAEVQYVTIPASMLGATTAAFGTATVAHVVGDVFSPGGFTVTVPINGVDVTPNIVSPAYLTYAFSTEGVVTAQADGTLLAATAGTTTVTATLGTVAVGGSLSVTVTAATAPAGAAPAPTATQAMVTSIMGDAFTNIPVDGATYDSFGTVTYTTPTIGGVQLYEYGSLGFVGIQFWSPGPAVNASTYTTLHVDVWPTATATAFGVKLVDSVTASGNSGACEVVYSTGSATLPLVDSQWNQLEIPLSSYLSATMSTCDNGIPLADTTAIGQLIFDTDTGVAATVYIDNVYFH